MTAWLREHSLLTYLLLYISLAFVYIKVFRARRLPVLKEAMIYLLIGVGALILWLFQLDLQMPVVQSMAAALSLMLIVRIRMFFVNRTKPQGQTERK
ncbi:YlaH-like family protein [Gorillibacterium sp. sgz5001074]|uniref:YlaH-like family protein n=1 Tax=Gorillibacterium sp. sgz5001074 TaxID=3446695 RepID=UPI003F67E3A2